MFILYIYIVCIYIYMYYTKHFPVTGDDAPSRKAGGDAQVMKKAEAAGRRGEGFGTYPGCCLWDKFPQVETRYANATDAPTRLEVTAGTCHLRSKAWMIRSLACER